MALAAIVRAFSFSRACRRAALPLAAAFSAAVSVSCSDALFGTGDGVRVASIALQPRFSERDAAIYASLDRFNLAVQTLRVVLLRPASTDTLADTTVTISEGQDSVLVRIQVELQSQEEILTAALEMRAGDIIVFSGSRSITARAGVSLAGAPPTLVPVWVGPGADATKIEAEPQDTTILVNESLQLRARALTSGGAEVTDPEYVGRFRWRVVDTALGTVTENGGVFTGKGVTGVARVFVMTPNLLRDTVSITLIDEVVEPGKLSLANGIEILDAGATRNAAASVTTVGGTALPGTPVTWTSRNPQVATVSASGVITGVTEGQAVIVANVTGNAGIADSLLAVVAHPQGPVVRMDVDRFEYPTDTTFTVHLLVDMRSTRKLGSASFDVTWNPAQLTYVSHAGGASLTPTVNANDVASGTLRLAFADAAGFSNTVDVIAITFTTAATAANGSLTMTTRELNEADTSVTDLLPLAVTVTHNLRTK